MPGSAMQDKRSDAAARKSAAGEEGRRGKELLCLSRADAANFFEAVAQALLESLGGGVVIDVSLERGRQAGHGCDFFGSVVGILIPFAIADIFHQAGDGVADVQGDRLGGRGAKIAEDVAIGGIDRIGFRSEREIDGGLSEGEMAFGSAE